MFCFVWDITLSHSIEVDLRFSFLSFFSFVSSPLSFILFFVCLFVVCLFVSANPMPVFFFFCGNMGSYCAKRLGLFCFVWDITSSHSIKVALRFFFCVVSLCLCVFVSFFFFSFLFFSSQSPFSPTHLFPPPPKK